METWDSSNGATLHAEGGNNFEDLSNGNITREYCFKNESCFTFIISDSYSYGLCLSCNFCAKNFSVLHVETIPRIQSKRERLHSKSCLCHVK